MIPARGMPPPPWRLGNASAGLAPSRRKCPPVQPHAANLALEFTVQCRIRMRADHNRLRIDEAASHVRGIEGQNDFPVDIKFPSGLGVSFHGERDMMELAIAQIRLSGYETTGALQLLPRLPIGEQPAG